MVLAVLAAPGRGGGICEVNNSMSFGALPLAAAVFSVAVLLSVVLTLLVRHLAARWGLVDKPDNRRKLHGSPTPLGGGVAIYLTTVIVLGGLALLHTPWQNILWATSHDTIALLIAGAVIVAVGILDDRIALRGRVKLLGQIGAVSILVFAGQRIERLALFGHEFELGVMAIPFTIFWLLGAINALNLLDGIDGLASTLGLIMIITIGVMAQIINQDPVPIIALVFACSILGFLVFNFPPATIFLGDAGSMLIGLVVGSLAIRGALKGPGTVLLAAPLAVWTIPIFDSLAAIVRRKLTGRSIYATDRGHMHHRLLGLLGSNRRVLLSIATFCLLTSLATVLSVALRSDLIALLSCAAIVTILIVTGIFGRAELSLVVNQMRNLGASLVQPAGKAGRVRQARIHLQGNRDWGPIWKSLIDAVEPLSLLEIRLDVNVSRAQEGYHAFWQRPGGDEQDRPWRLEVPLLVGGQTVGSLVLVGRHGDRAISEEMQAVALRLEAFDQQLRQLIEEPATVVLSGRVSGEGGKPSESLTRSRPR